jgi:hypothetical protein
MYNCTMYMYWNTGTNREFILKVTTSVVDPDPYVFLGLLDPDPSLFFTDPDPSIKKQKK